MRIIEVITQGPQGPQGPPGLSNTGSLATTGSNTFYGLQTISASNTSPSVLDIHAKDDGLWAFRVYNDTYSSSSIGLASWIDNTGISFLGTETNKPLYIYNNAQYYQPILSISSSGVNVNSPLIITGSARGNVTALLISSNTASINLSVGNFFTLQLISGSNTYIDFNNILPGQTSILTISTTGSATISFPSSVKQPSGSTYVPTTTTGIDILTFVSINTSSLYVVSIKNMI
jgi:hypothetical protein